MNNTDLKAFGIDLKHHLAGEQELFDNGLIHKPAPHTPESAKCGGTMTVHAEPPKNTFRIVVSEVDIRRKITISEIRPKMRIDDRAKYGIELRKRPNPLDGMDFNPRRRI